MAWPEDNVADGMRTSGRAWARQVAFAVRHRIAFGSAGALAVAVLVGACARMEPPVNSNKELFGPEKSRLGRTRSLSYTEKACAPAGTSDFILPKSTGKRRTDYQRLTMRYSPGDRLNVFVYGAQDFSGDYVVNLDGTVVLPYAGPVRAVGLTNEELGRRIADSYVKSGIFVRNALKLTTRPVQYAPINVRITGAVFSEGRHGINHIRDSDKLDKMLAKFGDSPTGRFVPAALQAAGGVRPDADLSRVKVTREGRTFTLDWRGAITGEAVDDMPLIEGDHVDVPESGCFQSALVRPTQVTPPGIRIFTSNLTAPSPGAGQQGNPQQANSVPYGTRFLQGLVHANCVGGSLATNARRYAVLISRNPRTRQTEVIQRPIEELVRSAHRDKINPYLMPDDAIACYDSAVSDLKEILSLFGTVLGPASSAKYILN
ncbi:MAG: polysaccharide biosynthesis/export family protein [Hyphomicrobiaceae bacterium]